MTAGLLIYAAIAGIAIVEGLQRAVLAIRVTQRLSQLQATLREFRAADDDDSRQRLMLQGGFRTLALSLPLFVALALACLAIAVPLRWTPPTTATLTAYMSVLGVAAPAWWWFRRTRG